MAERSTLWLRPLGFCIVLSGILTLGCGGSKADVLGTITFKGQPPGMKGIRISFVGEDGMPATAEVAEDGTYKTSGVAIGEVRVSISYVSPELYANFEEKSKTARFKKDGVTTKENIPSMVGGVAPRADKMKSPIPKHLSDPNSSRLVMTVERGKPNKFDYDIQPIGSSKNSD